MKLSFSTKGWHDCSFSDFCDIAARLGFSGIELHNVRNRLFTDSDAPFSPANSGRTRRDLFRKKIQIPCIDSICDLSDSSDEALKTELETCLELASNLDIPYIRVRSHMPEDKKAGIENARRILEEFIPKAEAEGVTLLLETGGLFASSADLSALLESFASDNLAALWNISAAFYDGGESAETVIKNLGAYVKHVHINDAVKKDGKISYCLAGEGEIPLDEVMLALRSVNYDGFLSLVWDPAWFPELDDMEIVYSQFVGYMQKYSDPSEREHTLYWNHSHTGQFVWKKDLLIEETFPQMLDRMVEEFPDQYAFKYTTLDYTRTYSQFRDDVDEFARALVALGVKAGSHVAVWASNVPQWYISFWAVVKIGAVLVSVNTAYKNAEIEYLLRQSDTHTLIMTEGAKTTKYGEIMAELCPELASTPEGAQLHSKALPFLRNIITVGYRQPGCILWEDALKKAADVPADRVKRMANEVKRDDVCNMQYTSGTTGFPKGVMLTHHNIVNNGKCIGDRMDLSTADRMMVQVPMFHCFGMVLAMTAAMTHGATLLPLPYFSAKPALACINNEHITAFHGVPTMFIALLEHPDFEKTDFSYMRTGIMAGSPCPVSAMRDVLNKMHMTEITIVYGQTEASPGCTMSSTDDSLEVRVGTVGHPLPEIECKIINPETGEDCPDGVDGEFVARGYNIMKGYYKMPRATSETVDKDGWLHTGDLACRNPDGNYRITGRLKDMIIRGGENIYPKELEDTLYTHPSVSDVQVVGVPDDKYGEEVAAVIILKEGCSATEKEMQSFMKERVAIHKVPKYIIFTDSFPMNAAGKILKYKIREDVAAKVKAEKAN